MKLAIDPDFPVWRVEVTCARLLVYEADDISPTVSAVWMELSPARPLGVAHDIFLLSTSVSGLHARASSLLLPRVSRLRINAVHVIIGHDLLYLLFQESLLLLLVRGHASVVTGSSQVGNRSVRSLIVKSIIFVRGCISLSILTNF